MISLGTIARSAVTATVNCPSSGAIVTSTIEPVADIAGAVLPIASLERLAAAMLFCAATGLDSCRGRLVLMVFSWAKSN